MKKVFQWSVARSGATMTIVGRDAEGQEVKITGVTEISAGCISPCAVDGKGQYWVLAPSSYIQICAALGKAEGTEEQADRCIACETAFVEGDLVHNEAQGGLIHAACCGPERESYFKNDGEPLDPGDPIPTPFAYRRDPVAAVEAA